VFQFRTCYDMKKKMGSEAIDFTFVCHLLCLQRDPAVTGPEYVSAYLRHGFARHFFPSAWWQEQQAIWFPQGGGGNAAPAHSPVGQTSMVPESGQ
jgi:hypothetical protein